MLRVRLLGSFEVKYKKCVVQIVGRPTQSLFAYLMLNGGTLHRREKLARMLWPDSQDSTARENLRHTLWRIRKALSSDVSVKYLLTDDFTVAFNSSAEYWFDVAILKEAKNYTDANDLTSSLSVYKGELLPGFYDEWVMLEREYLNFIFEHNMARLMAILQSEGRWLDILNWGEFWLTFGQKPEPAYRALMIAHTKKGDMSKVADIYTRCVRSLNEIGLEPSGQTRDLYKRLKAGKFQ